MKIFVTGATGFIGQHLVERLVKAGHQIDVRKIDIASPFTIPENFDIAIHLAAYNVTHVGITDSSIYSRVNVEGTKNVLSGVKARRFIFLSTTKVYPRTTGVVTEELTADPQQAYEQSKWQAEQQVLEANKESVILRSTNTYGPGQSEKAVIPIFFKRAMNGEPIKVFGPQGSWLQLIYIDDLVAALEQAIVKSQLQGVFNVASHEVIQLKDLALMIKRICNSSSEIIFTNEHSEAKMEISYHKFKEQTGWQPSVTLEKGLLRYYKYVQHHST